MTPIELAWLTGLYEGEGTLSLNRSTGSYVLAIMMTDEDVVRRAAAVAGVGRVTLVSRAPSRQRPRHKPLWGWTVAAKRDVGALVRAMRPLLGERRGAKANEVLRWADEGYPSLLTQERRDEKNRQKRVRRARRRTAGLPDPRTVVRRAGRAARSVTDRQRVTTVAGVTWHYAGPRAGRTECGYEIAASQARPPENAPLCRKYTTGEEAASAALQAKGGRR